MKALPLALAQRIVASRVIFNSDGTTDAERNAIVCDLLTTLRDHDPNISVWDLLPIFDLRDECPRCGLLSGHRYPCVG